MKGLELKITKGVKDWYGEDAILRNEIRDKLRKIFEKYGYNPLETPELEDVKVLGFKGGGEIQKEVFRLYDQGGRNLGLRFDQTVPLARFVGMHKEMKLPFKRYVIGPVFRDGPTQPEQGRYRIFTQCDVDIIGVKEMTAEAELFALAQDAFKELGLGDVEVKINSRKLLDGILDYAGVKDFAKLQAITALDKQDKIGLEGVEEELRSLEMDDQKLLEEGSIKKLLSVIGRKSTNDETYTALAKIINSHLGKEGLAEIKQLLDYSKSMGLENIVFDPSLARGLNYYTGTTIEVYLKNKDVVKSAILAGGRFDDMVGDFRGSGEELPAVGFSFGLERLAMILKSYNEGLKGSVTDIYLIPLNTTMESLGIAHNLRDQGLNVDMDLQGKGVKANIRYADASKIPYVGFIGDEELKEGVISVKRLKDGYQEKVKLEEVGKYLKR